MQRLFCLGLGYTAGAYIETYGAHFARIGGTVQSAAKQKRLTEGGIGGRTVSIFLLDGQISATGVAAIKASSCLLVSAPPASAAAAALAAFTNGGATTAPPPAVVYLSSLSIYGNHDGAEVDESAALQPTSERGCERIAAEEAWKKFGRETGSPVAILRLAGIYGPRRNALVTIANGQTKRIVTPNQVFNRIHVDDITQIVHAAFAGRCNGVFNAADDEPAPQTDVVAYAAKLLRQPLPPEVPFEKAKPTMSAMAKSFYEENKRAINRKIKSEFGLTLRYPNYRTGLDALFAARDHEGISA